ncbi:DUF4260 family protein [Histidinibacterium aquaticum]|uniref:DUF4260 family protein n=1 Tax=Histidinibacterium aquaticum TaxID=2613962 RepID=A0A5J5GIG6_9RHOB|nr:DUF4260 family protein [Histidinibacterium aquaticum]KAA9007955.1 DUF4260 family protein [Histidinibacterium aquaticum]
MDRALGWQRAEGLLVFLGGLLIFWQTGSGLAWWAAVLLFFAPDLSFAGYLGGPKVGAALYNSVHIYGFGAGLLGLGVLAGMPVVAALGALWLAHSGFDRMLGYGLKLPEGFTATHLGRIGPDA